MSNENFWTDEKVKEFFKKNFGCGRIDADIEQFKQEQLSKRDWEIVGFYDGCKNGHVDSRCLRSYSPSSNYQLIIEQGYTIHSVRRLSDGEIFVLGDDITWNKGINHGRIERFEISKNNGNMLAVHFSGGVGINNISKAKKQVLFTTKDGVDIFEEGVECFLVKVEKDFFIGTYYFNQKYLDLPTWHLFSTKESAEDWIVENKPLLSVKDIAVYWCINGIEKAELKQLAKSKMDKK